MKSLRFILSALLCGCGASQLPVSASIPELAPNSYTHHKTFRYVGKPQDFKVPTHVTHIFVIAIGGEGGGSPIAYSGRITAVLPVRSGELLYVRVGGNGGLKVAGYNGGGKPGIDSRYQGADAYGGGGATDIRERGDALQSRVLVAGGGGGQGGGFHGRSSSNKLYGMGGKGGGLIGGAGGNGYSSSSYSHDQCGEGNGGCGGGGGTQNAGGSGGAGGSDSRCYGTNGFAGTLGLGGAGAQEGTYSSQPYDCAGLGGGGGSGYYGGGGGGEGGDFESYAGGGGGGGGGSSYVEPSATNVHMWQGWPRNDYGLIVFSW